MKKHLEVNGEIVRKAREKRAWTQEELSERTRLGIRTVRRLEAGRGSWESIRRVAEELELKPEATLPQPNREREQRDWLQLDLLKIELSTSLLGQVPKPFLDPLLDKLSGLRKYIAQEYGWIMPGVRLCDHLSVPDGAYRIFVRELKVAEGRLEPDKLLAVARSQGELGKLSGQDLLDPCWQRPARWIQAEEAERARESGCAVFTAAALLTQHLRLQVELQAHRLLGLDDVARRLEKFEHRRLLEEVVPQKVDLITLRWVLRELLKELVPIRDLAAILESLADHAPSDRETLLRNLRADLAPLLSHLNAAGKTITAIGVEALPSQESLEKAGLDQESPLFLTSPELRRPVRQLLRQHPRWPVLSREEIAPGFSVIFSGSVV
ncbi:MAG: FHIPEP family type III secretion protein [Candidatus Eremiobacteraeota bacterium]|nr:FHIPEP family type III secretion protein [Candidatus Eremiobacteraeota bacterium]